MFLERRWDSTSVWNGVPGFGGCKGGECIRRSEHLIMNDISGDEADEGFWEWV